MQCNVDLTENQLFTLSPESRQVVRSCDSNQVLTATRTQKSGSAGKLPPRYDLIWLLTATQTRTEVWCQNPLGKLLESWDKRQLIQTFPAGEPLSEVKLTVASNHQRSAG